MNADAPKLTGFAAGIAAPLAFGLDRVKATLKDLSPEQLAQVPTGLKNSLATLALHLAATEIKFAYLIAGKQLPAEVREAYLTDLPTDPLPAATGETAESLLQKVDQARAALLEVLSELSEADIDREITMPSGRSVSVRFLLTLLPQHQGQHFGHMQYIKQMIG